MDHPDLPALHRALEQSWGLPAASAAPFEYAEVLDALTRRVMFMLRHEYDRLLAALYVLDVSEELVTSAQQLGSEKECAAAIAAAILEREQEKLESRRRYSRKLEDERGDHGGVVSGRFGHPLRIVSSRCIRGYFVGKWRVHLRSTTSNSNLEDDFMRDVSPTSMDRRNFLKSGIQMTAGAVAVGAALQAHGAAPENKSIQSTGKIPERPFGKTGHKLPVLGHGGSAMVNSWATAYNVTLQSEDERVAMVRKAYDMGIRYFDTARVYSESESIMGRGLKDVRDNVFIATKMAMPRPEMVRGSVETSLKELQTDYVDLMQIHSPAIERVGADEAMKLYEELEKLRAEGMIRFIGLTTHVAFEQVYKMIDTGNFDEVLLAWVT